RGVIEAVIGKERVVHGVDPGFTPIGERMPQDRAAESQAGLQCTQRLDVSTVIEPANDVEPSGGEAATAKKQEIRRRLAHSPATEAVGKPTDAELLARAIPRSRRLHQDRREAASKLKGDVVGGLPHVVSEIPEKRRDDDRALEGQVGIVFRERRFELISRRHRKSPTLWEMSRPGCPPAPLRGPIP